MEKRRESKEEEKVVHERHDEVDNAARLKAESVLDGDPASLPPKGDSAPNFRPIFIVVKRQDRSRWHLVWR